MMSDDDPLHNPPGNQATIISSIIIDNLKQIQIKAKHIRRTDSSSQSPSTRWWASNHFKHYMVTTHKNQRMTKKKNTNSRITPRIQWRIKLLGMMSTRPWPLQRLKEPQNSLIINFTNLSQNHNSSTYH